MDGDPKHLRKRANMGGSTLHTDKSDALHKNGSLLLYFNPYNTTTEGTDLIMFGTRDGGRGAQIRTMTKNWVAVVLLPSQFCLHGSIFPNNPGNGVGNNYAIRVVRYSLKHTVKLASVLGNSSSEKEQKAIMRSWKEKINLGLQNTKSKTTYMLRHVPVYEIVRKTLIEQGILVE